MAEALFFATGVPIFNPDISARGIPLKLFADIDWSGEVAQKLISASYRMNRFDVLTRTIARKLVVSCRRNIAESRSPSGTPYARLKNPRAPGHNTSGRPLFDTGSLYGDIRYRMVSDREALVGHTQKTWYGKLHQKGVNHPWTITPKGKKVLRFWTAEGWRFARSVTHPGIPARPFLGFRRDDVPDIAKAQRRWIDSVFNPEKAIGLETLEGEA